MKLVGVHNRPIENDTYDGFVEWCRGVRSAKVHMDFVRWSEFEHDGESRVACMMQDPIGRRKASVFPDETLNHPTNMNLAVRDLTYPIWRRAGLPCPPAVETFDYGRLAYRAEYPFLLKETGRQYGRSYYVDSLERLDWVHLEAERFDPVRYKVVRFVDTRYSDGLFRMHRYFVCGNQAIPVILAVTKGWLCKVGHMHAKRMTKAKIEAWLDEFEAFYARPVPVGVVEASQALGLDFTLVDCTICENGELMLWEVNPYVNMREDNIGGKPLNYWPFFANYLFGTNFPVMNPDRATLHDAFVNFEGYKTYWMKDA